MKISQLFLCWTFTRLHVTKYPAFCLVPPLLHPILQLYQLNVLDANESTPMGLPCPAPCVDEAVEGLRRDMLSLGLIWDEPQPDRDRKRRILTNWSLTDDILPRTPATDNEF